MIPPTLHLDVNRRSFRPALDGEWEKRSSPESTLLHSGLNNAAAFGADAIHGVAINPGNVLVGAGQVLVGTLGALKDLSDAAFHSLTADDLATRLDGEHAELEARGKLPHHSARRKEKLLAASANLRALREDDWKLVKEGLRRIARGAAFTVYDLGSMPVDAAQATAQLLGAGAIGFGRGIAAVARTVGSGLAAAARWLGRSVREGVEDTFTVVARGAARVADAVSNDPGPTRLCEPKDRPAHR